VSAGGANVREGEVRASWLIGACCSAVGATLFLIALWIASTVPGTYDANEWDQMTSVQVAFVLFIAGGLGQVIGFCICAVLVVLGGLGLRRSSGGERRRRIKELAWNAIGVLIPVGVIVVVGAVAA